MFWGTECGQCGPNGKFRNMIEVPVIMSTPDRVLLLGMAPPLCPGNKRLSCEHCVAFLCLVFPLCEMGMLRGLLDRLDACRLMSGMQ